MKFGALCLLLSFMYCGYAEASSCHEKCFESKQNCHADKGHTLNSCDDHLHACKASCTTGKPHKTYYSPSSLEIHFGE